MSRYRVGIIGTGRRGAARGGHYGIAEAHARAYSSSGVAELVAAADIENRSLETFCAEHGISKRFTDYREMLAREKPDLVSICTWVALHPEMVIAAAKAGVKGILCEKPMALTLPQADAMLAACKEHGARLSVNHQRRLGEPFRIAKEIAGSGDIGELIRIEGHFRSGSLYDSGTHWIDMMFFYLNDTPAVWVMAQVDCGGGPVERGLRVEAHSITHIEFGNGVRGYLEIGRPLKGQVPNRLIGAEGMIEILSSDASDSQTPTVRALTRGRAHWSVLGPRESIHSALNFDRAVRDLIRAVEEEREPELSGLRARATTEVIVAAYESALRRQRIELPLLTVDYSPLERLAALVDDTVDKM